MNEEAVYTVVLALLLVATLPLVAVSDGSPERETGSERDERRYDTTVDGVRYTVHPSELVRGCLTGKDCIPSVDDPRFQTAGEATWLRADDRVLGVTVDGEAKAYPLRILQGREVVNDELAGEPIVVTYCPLCRSGLTFSRRVDGRTLTFGVSGKLLHSNLVLYDRQTGTYWSQAMGRAIVGPLVPAELSVLPTSVTTWGDWRRVHPETLVLTPEVDPAAGGYPTDRYRGYRESDHVGYGVSGVDDRLPTKRIVYGVTVRGAAKAYPADVVRARDVVHDEVRGVPVLVVEDRREGSVKAFVRRHNGSTLRFRATGDGLVDQHGHRWSYDGVALDGPRRGASLERLHSPGFFWFAWYSFNPDTAVYGE